ncbi:MAG: cysteine desulfurase [Anaerolineales bacterium]|nr:cysteine desulfurase [Anaerolineales bacterium]MCB9127571.1 cysteine desulfurase [Ardenticatenales bacterium]
MIYLDHSATTPLHPEVLAAMMPYLTTQYGNPSSLYRLGQQARQAVENSRRRVAARLNAAAPREIVFTGGGTESDNLALRGIALARQAEGRQLITSAIEHEAVLATMEALATDIGFDLTVLPVDAQGRLRVADLAAALRPETTLVSVMAANNEVGTVQPIAEIGALLRRHTAFFHVDAVQAGGYLPIDVQAWGVDALSLSAHKFHGPKGVGLLYLRRGTPLHSPVTGGGQEAALRSGTHNVAAIVGFAEAFELAQRERAAKNQRLSALRDRLVAGLLAALPEARLSGHPTERLPGHVSLLLGAGIAADMMIAALDMAGIAASSGSACASGRNEASHVLRAMGVPEDEALSALRLTLGDGTTDVEIDQVIAQLPPLVARLREVAL